MALQITDLVSKEALSQLSKLNTELDKVKNTFAQVAQNMAINVNVNVQGREDLANLTKVITTNFNQMNQATERAKEAQKKFSTELGKEVQTIKQAQQYNKDLRKVRNEINTTTEDGKRKLKEYNEQIDKNTKYIKENSDAYTKQKMGIGGYFQSIMQGLTVFELLKQGVDFMRDSIKKALETIKEFEAANARLSAITGESARGMRELEGQARQLGKTTRYTATEITQLQTELAKLGFAKDDILAMTDSVYKFGLATGGSMADSAALAGAMLRTFGAQADETKRYVSALTAATTKSALSFGYLQVGLPLVAGGAATMGWSIEDVTALLGKLADSGLSASIAATALRNIFLRLSDTSSEMYAKLGRVENLDQFLTKLKELKAEGMDLGEILEVSGTRAAIPFANLVNKSGDVEKLRDAITGVGDELDAMANKINDTVEGSTYSLKSAWEALGLAFYNSKGWIKECIDSLTQLVRAAATAMTSLAELRAQYYSEFSMKEEDEWTNPEQRVVKGADGKVTTEVTTKRQDAIRLAQARYNDLVAQGIDKEKAKGQAIAESTKDLYEQINAAVQLKEKFGQMYSQNMAYEASIPFWRLDKQLGSQSRMRGYGEANAQGQAEQQAKIDSLQKTIDAINNWNFEPKKNSPKKTTTDTNKKAKKEKQETAKSQEEITALVLAYQRDRIKAELATTEQGSAEELTLKQDLLATEYAITLNNNKKIKDSTIADIEQSAKLGKITEEDKIKYIEQINNDYIQRNEEAKTKMREDDAVLEVESYARMFAMRRQMLDEQFAEESARNVEELNQRLADTTLNEKDRLQVIKDYKVKQKQLETDYNEEVRNMTQESIQEQIDLLDELLGMEAVDTELRAKLEKELADLKAKYAKASADEQIKQAERTAKNEEEKAAARRKLLEDYLNQAQDTFSAISDFASRLYENQLDDIDEEKDALDEKYDKDIERIERLEDQGAISSEEAEARKRAAKDQTEQKEEELNKKKQEIAYKQAVWEKATSASQTAISTALGIMKVWAAEGTTASKVIMTALVAAQGAMQLATILATPIPKYAKGTEGHKGGLAVVGDGGRSEFVMVGNQGWITPATSTLVDLPKGAQVFPDAKSVMMTLPVYNENGKQVKVVNDYKALEKKTGRTNELMVGLIREVHKGNSNYNQYKKTIW